jgi:hypothetical protein
MWTGGAYKVDEIYQLLSRAMDLPPATRRLMITAYRTAHTNVGSVFARLTGRRMVGALSFSLFLKIGPIPTRAVPWFTRRPGHESVDYDFFRELKLTEIVCSPRIAGPPNCNLYLVASIGELPIFNNVLFYEALRPFALGSIATTTGKPHRCVAELKHILVDDRPKLSQLRMRMSSSSFRCRSVTTL